MAALTQSHLGSTYPLPCWLKLCSAMLAQPICKHLPPPFSLLSCPHAQSLRSRHDFDFPPSLQQFKRGAGFTHTPVRSGFRLHPYMLELKNRMGATPTLLYARIPTWSVSRPLSLSLSLSSLSHAPNRYGPDTILSSLPFSIRTPIW